MFMGFKDIVVWEGNKKHVISYRGQHYVLDGKRMTKSAILARFEMHPAELDRYIGGGFKKYEAYANTNIVSVKRHIYDIQNVMQWFAFAFICVVFALVLFYAHTTKDTNAIAILFSSMFVSTGIAILSDELEKLPTSITDFICGVKRARA